MARISTWRNDMAIMAESYRNYESVDEEEMEESRGTLQAAMSYSLNLISSIRQKQQQRRRSRTASRSNSTSSSSAGSECDSSTCGDNSVELQPMKPSMNFNDLPILVQWLVFTYLDGHSLCQATMVCASWYSIASDELLWKRLLNHDSVQWNTVGHQTHPSIFTEAASDLPVKEIYLRCHPQASKFFGPSANPTAAWKLPFRLPNWFRRPLRIAMFGPGLETLPVARKMVFDRDAMFQPTGMTPGHEGVGSGVSIRLGAHNINLIILYKATKAERTRLSDVEEINRLVFNGQHNNPDNAAAGVHNNPASVPKAELTTRVKDMCRSVDAFVCVVDSQRPVKDSAAPLVHGMMAAGNASSREHGAPLLVMSATEGSASSDGTDRSSSHSRQCVVELADRLKLTMLTQPWRAQDVSLDDAASVHSALDWLLQQM